MTNQNKLLHIIVDHRERKLKDLLGCTPVTKRLTEQDKKEV